MKTLLVGVLCAGVLLVLLNQVVKAGSAPPAVRYRYLPRDLDTYLREQPYPSALLRGLWTDEDVLLKR